MAGWHHWLNEHEFEETPGVGDGQGGLACCGSWGRKESDTTERLNWLTDKSKVLVTLSCLILCNAMDYSTPSSSIHGILPARILEWVAISFSRQDEKSHIHFLHSWTVTTNHVTHAAVLHRTLFSCTIRILNICPVVLRRRAWLEDKMLLLKCSTLQIDVFYQCKSLLSSGTQMKKTNFNCLNPILSLQISIKQMKMWFYFQLRFFKTVC